MKFVFGIGTGRCGSHSLSDLLNKQKGFEITHELGDIPFLPWDVDISKLQEYLQIINTRKSKYCGDVAFYILPYIEYIINTHPKSKFIALKRDKKKTLKSFLKKTLGRNHWQIHDGLFFKRDSWDKCFPKYNCTNKEKALDLYYNQYYNTVEALRKKYPKNISLFDVDDLNSITGVSSILDFLEISSEDQIIEKRIKIKARNK